MSISITVSVDGPSILARTRKRHLPEMTLPADQQFMVTGCEAVTLPSETMMWTRAPGGLGESAKGAGWTWRIG
jgi:hypothetical protein